MYLLRLAGTDKYLARNRCGPNTKNYGHFDYQTTTDPNQALPLGNLPTAKTRAAQWLDDRRFMQGKNDPSTYSKIEIVSAAIVAGDVVGGAE